MTIRNRRGLTLAEQRSAARKQADFTNKVFDNAAYWLNRLANVAEVGKLTPPNNGNRGSITLYYIGDRDTAVARIEKVLEAEFDGNRMEDVPFSRIRLDVILRQKRERRRRAA